LKLVTTEPPGSREAAGGFFFNHRALASDSTKAGRRFVVDRSVKGKGTTTTSNASKVTIGLLVGLRHPLIQSAFQAPGKCKIYGSGLADMDIGVLDVKGNRVTGFKMEQAPHRLGYSRLVLFRQFACGCLHDDTSITQVIPALPITATNDAIFFINGLMPFMPFLLPHGPQPGR